MRTPLLVTIAAALTALTLAGCSASSGGGAPASSAAPPSTATATVTQTATPSTSAASSSSAPPSSPSSTPSSKAGDAANDGCANGQLAISAGQPDGATGHDGYTLLFRNTSTHTCTLHGYPGLDALRPGKAPVHATRTTYGFLGGSKRGIPTVRLHPGAIASAKLEYTFNGVGYESGNCPVAKHIAVTPANTTRSVTLTERVAICNLQIHPTVPGSTGQYGS